MPTTIYHLSIDTTSAGGQLKTSAALDYETQSSYKVTVEVSDGRGGTDTINVTITVTDVDETPPNNAPTFHRGNEHHPLGGGEHSGKPKHRQPRLGNGSGQ